MKLEVNKFFKNAEIVRKNMETLLLVLSLIVNITSTGTPIITLEIAPYTDMPLLNVTLPINPVPNTVLAVNACTGELIPILVVNQYALLPSSSCRTYITYYGEVCIRNYTFTLRINSSSKIHIVKSDNIIIIDPSIRGSEAILSSGSYNITYIVLPKPTIPPITINRTVIEEREEKTVVSEEKTRTTYEEGVYLNYLYYIVIPIVIGLIIIALILLRRRKTTYMSKFGIEYEHLREIDKQIIDIIKNHGGTLMQSELQKILNIPKTTLWRAVKRLEKFGYLRIEKVHGLNKLVLVKDYS